MQNNSSAAVRTSSPGKSGLTASLHAAPSWTFDAAGAGSNGGPTTSSNALSSSTASHQPRLSVTTVASTARRPNSGQPPAFSTAGGDQQTAPSSDGFASFNLLSGSFALGLAGGESMPSHSSDTVPATGLKRKLQNMKARQSNSLSPQLFVMHSSQQNASHSQCGDDDSSLHGSLTQVPAASSGGLGRTASSEHLTKVPSGSSFGHHPSGPADDKFSSGVHLISVQHPSPFQGGLPSPSTATVMNTTKKLSVVSNEEESRIRRAFAKYDASGTGVVDSSRLTALFREAGYAIPSHQVMSLLEQVVPTDDTASMNEMGQDPPARKLVHFEEFVQMLLIHKTVAPFRVHSSRSPSAPGPAGDRLGLPTSTSPGLASRLSSLLGVESSRRVSTVSVETSVKGDGTNSRPTSSGSTSSVELGVVHQHHLVKAQARFRAILPDGPVWKWAWDVSMLLLYFYLFCSVTTLYMRESADAMWIQASYFTVPDIIATIPLAAEMVLSCFTSFRRHDGEWEQSYMAIAKRYLRRLFWIDLVSLLPLRLFVSGAFSINQEQATSAHHHVGEAGWDSAAIAMIVVAHLRLVRCLRGTLLFSTSQQATLNASYVNFFYVMAPIGVRFTFLVSMIHVHAVIWLRLLADPSMSYGSGVYIAMYYFSGVGYGGFETTSQTIRLWACWCCIAALIVNGAVVGTIVRMMGQVDVEGARQAKLVETQAVLRFFEVPLLLQEEILQFQDHILNRDLMRSHKSLIESLPLEIQNNLEVQIHLHLLSTVPVIAESHDAVKIALVQQLSPVVCCPEEFVVVAGELAEDIIFIHYGFVDLIDMNGEYVTTLRNGQPLAEALLFAPYEPQVVTVTHELSGKSLGYSELLVLSVASLDAIKKLFVAFSRDLDELGDALGVVAADDGPLQGDPQADDEAPNTTVITIACHPGSPRPRVSTEQDAWSPHTLCRAPLRVVKWADDGQTRTATRLTLSTDVSIANLIECRRRRQSTRKASQDLRRRTSLSSLRRHHITDVHSNAALHEVQVTDYEGGKGNEGLGGVLTPRSGATVLVTEESGAVQRKRRQFPLIDVVPPPPNGGLDLQNSHGDVVLTAVEFDELATVLQSLTDLLDTAAMAVTPIPTINAALASRRGTSAFASVPVVEESFT